LDGEAMTEEACYLVIRDDEWVSISGVDAVRFEVMKADLDKAPPRAVLHGSRGGRDFHNGAGAGLPCIGAGDASGVGSVPKGLR
jgi:hypothetical protein